MIVQVTAREETLHFQIGEQGKYYKVDLPLTGKEKFSGLKTATSLYGSDTVYYVIPKTALGSAEKRTAFKKRHGISLVRVAQAAKSWTAKPDEEEEEY